jgi:hypothetical protein
VTDDQIFDHWPGVSNFDESERISEKLLQLLSFEIFRNQNFFRNMSDIPEQSLFPEYLSYSGKM